MCDRQTSSTNKPDQTTSRMAASSRLPHLESTVKKTQLTKQQSQVSFDGIEERYVNGADNVSNVDSQEQAVQMREKATGILAFWRNFRRSVRRYSSILYSAAFQQNRLKCQRNFLIALLIVLLVGMATMGFFLWQLHTENKQLRESHFQCQEESKCSRDLVSSIISIHSTTI